MNQTCISDDFLPDGERAGLYHLPAERRDAIEQQARRLGFRISAADLSASLTIADALTELGRACAFPDWYGANFDALFDCLADTEALPAPGQLLLIAGLAALRRNSADELNTLLEVFAAAAEDRRSGTQPLWILIDAPAAGVPLCPGA